MTTSMQLASALGNHLWQSTALASFAWLLTLVLRKNQARIRFWLWMIVSAKFLVPFSLLVAAGGYLRTVTATPIIARPQLSAVMEQIATPFPQMESTTAIAPAAFSHNGSLIPILLLIIWACGFMAVAFSWFCKWRRIRAAQRTASPLALRADVPVLSSPSLLEPGIFGIFRPVLLLPEGIAERLTPAQLDAIVAHEMCHVRRRDNLSAAIHMVVEAVFWFHPLVWWIGSRLVEERERACDEEVLRLGGDPEIYAEGILNVCKFYVECPLTCVSGISGSDLKKRILRIMTQHLTEKLTIGRKLVLSAASLTAIAGPLVFGTLNVPLLGAQNTAADWEKAAGGKMKFEVASVKENNTPPSPDTIHFNVPITTWDYPVGAPTGGLYSATNLFVDIYLGFAYKLQGYANDAFEAQLPKWARFGAKRYDVEARAAGNPTRDQYRLMMQSLLVDRFKLAVHWDTKQMPAMALVLAKPGKLGPQLRAHVDAPPCPDSPDLVLPQIVPAIAGGFPLNCGVIAKDRKNVALGNTRYFARNVPMASLAVTLSTSLRDAGKPIVDKTGLSGNYDFVFEYTPDNQNQSQSDGIRLTDALKDDLGLKLEPATAPVDVLVLDHIEEPSEN